MKYNHNKIIKIIKNDQNLLGIKIFYNNNDYTIYEKKKIYNIYQKNFKDGLIESINSNLFPKKLKYEPVFKEEDLKY